MLDVGLTYHLEKAVKYDIKKVVKQLLEGPLRASWATMRTRLSSATLTVMPTLLPSTSGLAMTSFPNMRINLTTATGLYEK